MKQIKSIGKAALYFLLYFGVQTIMSLIFCAILAIKVFASSSIDDFDIALANAIDENTMLISLISNIATILVVWLIFKIRKKSFFSELEIKKIRPCGVVALIVFGACMNIVMSMLLNVLPLPESWWAQYNESSSAVSTDTTIIGMIAAAILAPITEEIVFRGLIYRTISKGCGIWIGAIVSALIFGIMHGAIIWALYAFILGFILAMIYAKTGSLLSSVLVHFGFNAINYFIYDMNIYLVIVAFIIAGVSAVKICVYNVADAEGSDNN